MRDAASKAAASGRAGLAALAVAAALFLAGCAASYHPYGWPAGASAEAQKPSQPAR